MSKPDPTPVIDTDRLAVRYQRDGGPTRYRIGLIALDSDIATEPDFHRLLPAEAMFYTTRIRHVNPVSVENLRKQAPQLEAAAERLLPGQRLDVIAYSCTSATAAIGFEAVARQIRGTTRTGVPVVTPITAAVAACEAMGIRSISLLTPHPDAVNQSSRRFFESSHIRVLNIASFDLEDDIAVAGIPPAAIEAAAVEACRSDADAVFISSTALRAVEIIERAERAVGRPVLSAVQCLFWQSLRAAGCDARVNGFGCLLRQ